MATEKIIPATVIACGEFLFISLLFYALQLHSICIKYSQANINH